MSAAGAQGDQAAHHFTDREWGQINIIVAALQFSSDAAKVVEARDRLVAVLGQHEIGLGQVVTDFVRLASGGVGRALLIGHWAEQRRCPICHPDRNRPPRHQRVAGNLLDDARTASERQKTPYELFDPAELAFLKIAQSTGRMSPAQAYRLHKLRAGLEDRQKERIAAALATETAGDGGS